LLPGGRSPTLRISSFEKHLALAEGQGEGGRKVIGFSACAGRGSTAEMEKGMRPGIQEAVVTL